MYNKKTDWSFPMMIDGVGGRIKMVPLEDDIKQSLFILLSTQKGERLMRPDYGCSLNKFAFENITYSLLTRIEDEIISSIKTYETRIENVKITINENESSEKTNELIVCISYNIKGSQVRQNFNYELNNGY